ncbi:hypothetical protein [Nocardia sp. NPDC050175]|uniref:hypothetical protein n=1 Tax=Nocardia sp. NPDC050175 TaxID=3364317 RepID=UPI0037AA5EBB
MVIEPPELVYERFVKDLMALHSAAQSPGADDISDEIESAYGQTVSASTIRGWLADGESRRMPRKPDQFKLMLGVLHMRARWRFDGPVPGRWEKRLRAAERAARAVGRFSEPGSAEQPVESAEPQEIAADKTVPSAPFEPTAAGFWRSSGRWVASRPKSWLVVGVVVLLLIPAAVTGTVLGVRSITSPKSDIAVVPFTWTTSSGGEVAYVLPKEVSDQLDPPPTDLGFGDWAEHHHGIPAAHTFDAGVAETGVALTLRAKNAGLPVTLLGLSVEVLERRPPVAGTTVSHTGGDSKSGRFIVVDGDSSPPTVIGSSNDPRYTVSMRAEPIKFPYTITTTDSEVFLVYVDTHRYHLKWRLRIEWSTGVASGKTVIDNGGDPFEVTLPADGNKSCFLTDERWTC